MTLKLNGLYKTDTGYIIPRSYIYDDLAIFEVLTGGELHYVKGHCTFTTKELKKILKIKGKERIEIL